MGYKDKMKKSQESNDTPRLNILQRFEVKEGEDGKAVFQYYDSEAGERKNHTRPIEGVYVGRAYRLTCYDDDLGTRGGSYFSSYYFSNKFITLYRPSHGGVKRVMTGDMDAIESYLSNAKGNPSKKMVLFVLTKGGLVEVYTNMAIAIDQFRVYVKENKDRLLDNMIKLTPMVYHKDNKDVPPKAKEVMGKFADKNPPKYASLSQGGPITDEIAEEWDVEGVCDEFLEWKEYHKSRIPKEGEDKHGAVADVPQTPGQGDGPHTPPDEEEGDDLPF